MTKNNYLLLLSMFFACTGAFIFFPFLTSFAIEKLGMSSKSIGEIIGISILVGHICALGFSLNCKPAKERGLFVFSLFFVLSYRF